MRADKYSGLCSVCGEWSLFINNSKSIRETYQCIKCNASMRERVTADGILTIYSCARHTSLASLITDKTFSALSIYEPGISGAYRSYFSKLENYINSFYFEGVKPGEEKDGVRNEDLMSLSFQTNSFDLVISSDIFEHIRRPWLAFKEIRRVLKLGGFHIFSIPTLVPLKLETTYRVDTTTDQDIPIKELYYHGDGRGGKSLVYTEFGADIFDKLHELGFQTFSIRTDHTDDERLRVNAFVTQAI